MTERFKDYVVVIVICIGLILGCVFIGMPLGLDKSEELSTWPESMEFSQLETGQDRFSIHKTNIDGLSTKLYVIVDHRSGTEYLMWKGTGEGGICQMTDAQGEPSLVLEAGE